MDDQLDARYKSRRVLRVSLLTEVDKIPAADAQRDVALDRSAWGETGTSGQCPSLWCTLDLAQVAQTKEQGTWHTTSPKILHKKFGVQSMQTDPTETIE
jgi:hypothetical protein